MPHGLVLQYEFEPHKLLTQLGFLTWNRKSKSLAITGQPVIITICRIALCGLVLSGTEVKSARDGKIR